jgi:putative ATP-binding cassette transporter
MRVATEAPVDFVTGMTTAVLSAATFIVVLWTIGGALTVNLGGPVITIPGFLVVAAVVYAVVASGSMVVIGRRFIWKMPKPVVSAEFPIARIRRWKACP